MCRVIGLCRTSARRPGRRQLCASPGRCGRNRSSTAPPPRYETDSFCQENVLVRKRLPFRGWKGEEHHEVPPIAGQPASMHGRFIQPLASVRDYESSAPRTVDVWDWRAPSTKERRRSRGEERR